MTNLQEDIKKLGLSNSQISNYSQSFTIEEIGIKSNYEFSEFLKPYGFDPKEIQEKDEATIKDYYTQFLILSLTDLYNPAKVRDILIYCSNQSSSEIEWLKKVRDMMVSVYSNAPDISSSDYDKFIEVIDRLIEEIEVRAVNQANRETFSEVEMPIDMDEHYYTLKLANLQQHKSLRLDKDHKEFRSAYFNELSNRLSKGLSSTELEPFLKHQLKFINDKIGWLRYVDHMMNRSNRHRDEHPKSNDSILMDLIPALIGKIINPKNEILGSDDKKIVLVDIDQRLMIETKFTIHEIVLLEVLLNLSGIIDTEHLTNTAKARFIANHFTKDRSKDSFQEKSVIQAMKRVNPKAIEDLDEKLDRIKELLKHKAKSIV